MPPEKRKAGMPSSDLSIPLTESPAMEQRFAAYLYYTFSVKPGAYNEGNRP
jgi:hypothetical protein